MSDQPKYKTDKYDCICRFQEDFEPDVVFIIGNGAIRNGTRPLAKVLHEKPFLKFAEPEELVEYLKNPDLATPLAQAAYSYQFARNHMIKSFVLGQGVDDRFFTITKGFYEFRKALADEYLTAKDLELNPVDKSILERLHSQKTGVITLNWDLTLWKDAGLKNLLQLHGSCKNTQSMILPSQLNTDDHIIEVVDSLSLHGKISMPDQYFERKSELSRGDAREIVMGVHGKAIEWLEKCKTLVIWGVAFNAYDAELLAIISISKVPHAEVKDRVIIVNPDPRHRDIAAAILGARKEIRLDADPTRGEWITPNEYEPC